MKDQDKTTSITKGGFEFRFTPSKRVSSKVSHYLHIYWRGRLITPKKAGAFINLLDDKWDPVVICDESAIIPLTLIINEYFGTINNIKYFSGDPGSVKDFRDINSNTSVTVWKRDKY